MCGTQVAEVDCEEGVANRWTFASGEKLGISFFLLLINVVATLQTGQKPPPDSLRSNVLPVYNSKTCVGTPGAATAVNSCDLVPLATLNFVKHSAKLIIGNTANHKQQLWLQDLSSIIQCVFFCILGEGQAGWSVKQKYLNG